MDTDAIKGAVKDSQVLAPRQRNPKSDFAKVLSEQQRKKGPVSGHEGTLPGDAYELAQRQGRRNRVCLGTISETTPTVSHLLVGHSQYGEDCWRIVHSEQNRQKPYTRIRTGTAIFMDPETLEITWGEEGHPVQPMAFETQKALADRHGELQRTERSDVSMKPKTISQGGTPRIDAMEEKGHPVLLGTITEKIPTVSHLLIDNPRYGKDAWQIIHSQMNRHKPYTDIQPGTAVYLDRETQEIHWGREYANTELMASVPEKGNIVGAEGLHPFSTQLAKAVEPYIGRPYEEVDCYELVVKGLVSLGVRYHGTGGLLERLKNMATQEGLPVNAYLNGEGLVEASGTKVYSRSFVGIRDAQTQAHEVIDELDALLGKGFIVSFSTHTKGHTGIVSQRNGEWTFINSGRMDHGLGMGTESRLVGEERLSEEIKDWFELAAERKESLKITVGRLNEQKLMTFRDDRSTDAEEA